MKPRLFLNEKSAHPSGLTLDDVLNMDDNTFEDHHDLIQWMFPTMRQSTMQPQSPVLEWIDVLEIRADLFAQHGVELCQEFYTEFLQNNQKLWLVRHNHNHLRITRTIESLSLLGDESACTEFHAFVSQLNSQNGWPVNMQSVQFWNEARFYGQKMDAEHG